MIQKKKFVKTFRNTKTVQLILLLLLETAYVLVLTLNPAPVSYTHLRALHWAQSFSKTGLCLSYAHFPGSLHYLI